MVWVRIDDSFAQHPKVVQAGPLAMAMQVAGLCYSNRNLTDGFIPWAMAHTLLSWEFLGAQDDHGRKHFTIAVTSGMAGDDVDGDFVIGLLLDAGMWEEVDGGYFIHDYPDYQPTRGQVEAERQKKQAAGQAGGMASALAHAKRSAKAESKPVPVPVPVPVSPIPNPAAAPSVGSPPPAAADSLLPLLIDGYENTISANGLNPTIADELRDWATRLPTGPPGERWIAYTFAEAARQNKPRWSYVESILRRGEDEGWPSDPGELRWNSWRKQSDAVEAEWTERRYREGKAAMQSTNEEK